MQTKNRLNQSDDVTNVFDDVICTSFDRKFKRVFDQTKHCKTFFLLALNLGELYCEFNRLKVKNCVVSKSLM